MLLSVKQIYLIISALKCLSGIRHISLYSVVGGALSYLWSMDLAASLPLPIPCYGSIPGKTLVECVWSSSQTRIFGESVDRCRTKEGSYERTRPRLWLIAYWNSRDRIWPACRVETILPNRYSMGCYVPRVYSLVVLDVRTGLFDFINERGLLYYILNGVWKYIFK